ncbi:enolase-phosphatase E1 [Prorops nasuta]|uniref:enolase-phosphatase E1 n=1 Tax=Prorops nasuta TaxID=863751 RepID=UPI0034D00EBF
MASISSPSSSSSSSDEETELSDLKPIKEYLSNRRELARQIFKSVRPEKIQMMLPQILKKSNLKDLEEWCASELSGMSKVRILSILNGTPLLTSSNTEDSDDSGPSLEIISDTEEWLTDDASKREDVSSSTQRKISIKKEKNKVSKKSQMSKKEQKAKVKNSNKEKNTDVKIKKETIDESNKETEKEGDSLLDLLELEMRARAIRALIRKEEDIIPDADKSSNATNKSADALKTAQSELRAKEKCRKQLEEIITFQQNKIGDDDVVLVVQPTPTIELLSSDSEDEQCKRIKETDQTEKKLLVGISKVSGVTETEEISNKSIPATTNKVKFKENSKTSVKKKDRNAIRKVSKDMSKNSTDKSNISERHEEVIKTNEINEDSKLTAASINQRIGNTEKAKNTTLINEDEKLAKSKELSSSSKEEIPVFRKSNISDTTDIITNHKDNDGEEIIDLDDYSNDMDSFEISDFIDNEVSNENTTQNQNERDDEIVNLSETWATRYYQTDDVQHVLKESKIQSEIRKRLRERQRLFKLNNTSNTIAKVQDENKTKILEPKPTGSVEEYLALKNHIVIDNTIKSSNDESVFVNNTLSTDPSNQASVELSNINENTEIK